MTSPSDQLVETSDKYDISENVSAMTLEEPSSAIASTETPSDVVADIGDEIKLSDESVNDTNNNKDFGVDSTASTVPVSAWTENGVGDAVVSAEATNGNEAPEMRATKDILASDEQPVSLILL